MSQVLCHANQKLDINIALDTNAIINHVPKLIDLSERNSKVCFTISFGLLAETFQKPNDEFHDFIKQVGSDRWKLGCDWLSSMLSRPSYELFDKKLLELGISYWSAEQTRRLEEFRRQVLISKEEFRRFLSRHSEFIAKLEGSRQNLVGGISEGWFAVVENYILSWVPSASEALWALEVFFPKESFDASNPTVALAGFMLSSRLAGFLVTEKDRIEYGVEKVSRIKGFAGKSKERIDFFDVRIAAEAIGSDWFATADENLLNVLAIAESKKLINFRLMDLRVARLSV